jgi:hypothetical protein
MLKLFVSKEWSLSLLCVGFLFCVCAQETPIGGQRRYSLSIQFVDTGEKRVCIEVLTRSGFTLQVHGGFKELAGKNGYTVTVALEKFMSRAVEFGLVFPSAKAEAAQAEARAMLVLKNNTSVQ